MTRRKHDLPDAEELVDISAGLNSQSELSRQQKNRKKIIIIVVCAFVVVALCVTGFLLYRHYEEEKARERAFQELVDRTVNTETFYEGVVVEGIDLGGKTLDQAKEALASLEPDLRQPVDITVTAGGNSYQLTTDDFTYTYNTDEVLDEAYQVARTGERMDRYNKILDLKENPVEFSIEAQMTVDDAKLQEFVDAIAAEVNVAPVEASVTSFSPLSAEKFTYAEGQDGQSLNTEKLLADIKELLAADDKTGTLEGEFTVNPHTTTVEQLKARTVLMSSYSTTSTNTAAGTNNMRLALEAVNGTVLQPDEVFSFNNTTGDTTDPSRGYQAAGAIMNGQSVQSIGGGICQASTTIYGAAMRADMDITMRYNHVWPSTYVPLGQDATVDYPSVDFQFRNSSQYPVYIAAWVDGVVLHVEFYGYIPETWDTIEVSTWTTETIPAPEAITEVDSSLAPGTTQLVTQAHTGYRAAGERIYYKNGQRVGSDPIHSSYYPANAAVYKVGPSE